MKKIKQPEWCSDAAATVNFWGCWSLLDGLVKNEDYCKNCDYYKSKEK